MGFVDRLEAKINRFNERQFKEKREKINSRRDVLQARKATEKAKNRTERELLQIKEERLQIKERKARLQQRSNKLHNERIARFTGKLKQASSAVGKAGIGRGAPPAISASDKPKQPGEGLRIV